MVPTRSVGTRGFDERCSPQRPDPRRESSSACAGGGCGGRRWPTRPASSFPARACSRGRWWSAGCCGARCWPRTSRTSACCCRPASAAWWSTRPWRIDGRVAVNLNYTLTSEVINDCIAQCGIRHVLTSRRVMERFNLKLNAKVVYLEDFLGKITLGDKLRCGRRGLAGADRVAGTPAGADESRPGRPADDHLHFRLDRPAQGRDAHAAKRRLERRPPWTRSSALPTTTCCWAFCRSSILSATR